MPDIKQGTIQITGLSDLERKLREFPVRFEKNVMRGAVRAGAVVIQKEAKNKCPDSAEKHFLGKEGENAKKKFVHYLGKGAKRVLIKSGSLKKYGIKVKQLSRREANFTITYRVYFSKKYWYGKFVEAGTSKMAARAPLRKGFDRGKEAATVAIREYMAIRINKEVASLGNRR